MTCVALSLSWYATGAYYDARRVKSFRRELLALTKKYTYIQI
jgi:hypothetical protein